jgi:hypothetical protein
MALVKTQIYLTREQHRGLSRDAERQGISLAELVRRLAASYLQRPRPKPTPASIRGIVKLGRSGITDTSSNHHRVLDDLLGRGAVR